MEIHFTEQDLINAVAVTAATERHGEFDGCNPEREVVELRFNNGTEQMSAVSNRDGLMHRSIHFDQQGMFRAVECYLLNYHSFNPEALSVTTTFDHSTKIYSAVATVI